jgi:broad-specificity NMP kinase
MDRETVTIVSGLPRSGTSMMMKMLEVGGMRPLTDNVRTADDDNPKGYYELERVKDLEKDTAWVDDARGRVVKVISMLLRHLPAGYAYKVIFMRRKMEEVLASQRTMLIRRGESPDKVSDEKMAAMFEKHLSKLDEWLARQPNIDVLYIHYTEALDDPAACAGRINEFLGATLDVEKMASVVDEALYRQRR